MGLGDIFKLRDFKNEISRLQHENQTLVANIQSLENATTEMRTKLKELGAFDYYKVKEMTRQLEEENNQKQADFEEEYNEISEKVSELRIQEAKVLKNLKTQTNKLNRSKELVKAINYTFEKYLYYEPSQNTIKLPENDLSDLEEITPSIMLKLHCMDVKDLRKAYRENDKQINSVLEKYAIRYTTKANQAIYKLMVIALRAELQNILYNLKYEKLDRSIEDIKKVTQKYLKIASEGNQSISGTLTKFIGEIEYLFINAVIIEYNYYVKKEQAKQEQMAIREQIRQEAEERRALEVERKKVEKEEAKYQTEIEKIREQLASANNVEIEKLNARILELQNQLAEVTIKKEEISNLANGKAGNVYVISNLGSFGENVFKIGMTRRLNPQDRVNELGDASVPFKFDVHSFIFSDDAVALESKLHDILNEKRVNKVNMRKEFFYTNVDELEELVMSIEPTAEFNKTMLAEEFRQSQSSDGLYTSTFSFDEEDDEEETE